MANEVYFDTSGFFALIDEHDRMHQEAVEWMHAHAGHARPVTTEWVIGETCTLLVARKRQHVIPAFLDYVEHSRALLSINPDDTLLRAAKAMIRRQANQGYSFVDCISFCVMKERRVKEAFTTDTHFHKVGFSVVLA